ncbi:MAG: tetratricopeptide repeat protein [Myxococcota bacterium]
MAHALDVSGRRASWLWGDYDAIPCTCSVSSRGDPGGWLRHQGARRADAPATPTAAPDKPAPAADPVAAPDPAAKPDPATEPAAAVEKPAEVVENPGEDWLVWSPTADGWVTRWLSVRGDDYAVVAERKAVIVSDGAKLFRVERHDVTRTVKSCDCVMESEDAEGCKVTGKMVEPGLRGFDLAGGDPIGIHTPSADELVGGDFDFSVDLAGGVGTQLIVATTASGYECGAHGNSSGSTALYDLAKGPRDRTVFEGVQKKLPAAIRTAGITALMPDYKECDGDDATPERAADELKLEGVHVSIGEDGAPRLEWSFVVDVYYACSADYLVHGSARSGLLAEASDLGLAGPLPGGVVKAMGAATHKWTVGWSKLALTGEAREAALTAFKAAPEPVWPGRPQVVEGAGVTALVKAGRDLSNQKDYSAAIAKFSEAIAIDGSVATAWSGRGYANLRNKTLDAAKTDLKRALEIGGDAIFEAQVQYNLGLVAEQQNDKPGARAAFERSLELRPHKSVEKALARVKE